VAFASNRGGSDFNLYLIHPDGTGLQPVPDAAGGNNLFPAWSPDGTKLVYASNASGAYQLRIHDIDTSSDEPVATGVASATTPAFSPNGKTLAFSGAAIYTIPVGGGSALALTDGTTRDSAPVWAPDGELIYFSSNRSGQFEVWSMKPDGSSLTQITTSSDMIGGIAVAPDGATLAYANSQLQIELWTLATASAQTVSAMNDDEPALSSSGTQLAVTTTRYGSNSQIVLLDLPGGTDPFRLTDDEAVDGQAAFQP
jgi:TolB protein